MNAWSANLGTAANGPVTIDLAEVWWHAWAREWRDLGQLAAAREGEEHMELHETQTPFCECFNCRALRAWERRHDPILPKARRKRSRL